MVLVRSAVVATAAFFVLTLPLELIRGYVQAAVLAAIDALGWVPHDPNVSIGYSGWSFQGVAPPLWMVRLLNISSLALLALPGMWAALFLYHRMVRRAVWLDGTTRCGQCGATLRNLQEARCPSCSKRI